ncbi:hypothetical protein J5N97_010725 [Dioscorea zingiberensis]|uniref:Uncharacterized protein n=1 Tax=Dioscorea zingiberensis TaxID=325984 RepID=A0A9D5HMN8_9LILI|nr:hypothetical protein J5N97_010725 [Dioscorea zingiberensis]
MAPQTPLSLDRCSIKQCARCFNLSKLGIPRDHQSPRRCNSVRHFIKHLPCNPSLTTGHVHEDDRAPNESIKSKAKFQHMSMHLQPYSAILHSSTSLENIRKSIVIRMNAIVQHLLINLHNSPVFSSQQEGFQHGVANAEGGVRGVLEDRLRVAEASIVRIGAQGR